MPAVDPLSARKFQATFDLLRTANEYANFVDVSLWQFAVGVDELRRIGLTDTDLRLLLQLKLVEHAAEQPSDSWIPRQVRLSKSLIFSERSCFILTDLGRRFVHGRCVLDSVPERASTTPPIAGSVSGSPIPSWSSELRVLSFRGEIVKRFARPALNQALVLAAFEEEKWPPRIYDPLAPQPSLDIKRRLCDTIKSLNQGHSHSLIRFRGDGSGEGILWEPATCWTR